MLYNPECTAEAGGLPVALCAKTDTLGHETLGSKAGNLVEAHEVGVVNVCTAQIVKVCGEGGGALVGQYSAKGNFGLGGILHLFPIHLFPALVNLYFV